MTSAQRHRGFTLIELMLVVAIIGLLASIAIPKFANLVIKAKEAAIKGKLGSLRSAVSIYYADNEGFYPADGPKLANSLKTGSRYLDAIPFIGIPTQISHNTPGPCNTIGSFGDAGYDCSDVSLSYAWAYNAPAGHVFVNCTHTDSKGTTWSLW